MNFQDYINAELLVLIPVLYLIGMALKKSDFNDKHIPLLLGALGILFSGIYIFATTAISGSQEIANAVFGAITQGVLAAGASVYVNQIYKQETKGE